jgi:helix-turn-helix protein
MKVIKPFFLGMLGGLAVGLALWVGLYFSPLRQDFYFAADSELADVRAKLGQYQEWLAQTDLRLAQAQTYPAIAVVDSLRTAQAKAWRDYKVWRNRLGELARAHDKPTAEGFWPWTFSLAYWILPIAALLALLPGVIFALRARSRFLPGKVKAPPKTARAQALAHFQDAVKKVARISELERGPVSSVPPIAPVPPTALAPAAPTPLSTRPPAKASISTDDFGAAAATGSGTAVEFPVNPVFDRQPGPVGEEPRKPMPAPHAFQKPPTAPPRLAESRDPGRETAFFQLGVPWGDPAGERIGNPIPPGVPPPGFPPVQRSPGLSMEDEDGPRVSSADGDADGEETLGVMPPTTEVERVERRKEEVLKLARKGMTSSEISRRMRISQDQVDFIIRLRREKG